MEPFYRKIYNQAWQTLKNNLHLLFFGLFASLLGFNEIKIFFDFEDPSAGLLSSALQGWWQTFTAIMSINLNFSNLNIIASLIGLFIIIAAIVIIAIASQAALMNSAWQSQNNIKLKKLKFNQNLQIGLEKFWPLLGINLLYLLISYYFLSFIVQPLITIVALNSGLPYFLLLSIAIFFIIIPLIVMLAFAIRFGIGYIVIYNQDMLTAFKNGWYLFKINWLLTIESALAIIGTTIIYFLAMLLLIILTFSPFIIVAFTLASHENLAWLMVGLGTIIGMLILIVATSLYGAFYNLVWSNIFLRLTGKTKAHSKIHRLAQKHVPHMVR